MKNHVGPHFKCGSKLDIKKKNRLIAMLTLLSLAFERLVYKHFKQLILNEFCHEQLDICIA